MYRVSAHPLFSRYRLSAHPVNPPAHGFSSVGISNAVDGSEDDEIRDEIPRDIEADITDGAHNEEDPDAEIDELDFFSDED